MLLAACTIGAAVPGPVGAAGGPDYSPLAAASDVAVECGGPRFDYYRALVPGARGFWDGGQIVLDPNVCDQLLLLRAGTRSRVPERQYDFAHAVVTWGHELAHARGEMNENRATCAALASWSLNLARLGVRPAYARALRPFGVLAAQASPPGWRCQR